MLLSNAEETLTGWAVPPGESCGGVEGGVDADDEGSLSKSMASGSKAD